MRRSFSAIVVLALAGCGGYQSRLPMEMKAQIPKKANAVRTASSLPPKELFLAVQKSLLAQGYRISAAREDLLHIATEEKTIEGVDGLVRLNIAIEPKGSGSELTAKGECALASSMTVMSTSGGISVGGTSGRTWEPAYYGVSFALWTCAFDTMAHTVSQFPHDQIEFLAKE